jgi:hypothetical protein
LAGIWVDISRVLLQEIAGRLRWRGVFLRREDHHRGSRESGHEKAVCWAVSHQLSPSLPRVQLVGAAGTGTNYREELRGEGRGGEGQTYQQKVDFDEELTWTSRFICKAFAHRENSRTEVEVPRNYPYSHWLVQSQESIEY